MCKASDEAYQEPVRSRIFPPEAWIVLPRHVRTGLGACALVPLGSCLPPLAPRVAGAAGTVRATEAAQGAPPPSQRPERPRTPGGGAGEPEAS